MQRLDRIIDGYEAESEEERLRKQKLRTRKGNNLQIYIKANTQLLQELGSSSLRAFLLKGLTDFFSDKSDCMKLIVSRKLFDIKSITRRRVEMLDGTVHCADFISIVTSETVVMNKNVDLVISAIASVRNVMSITGKSVHVASLYFTDEEEILQIMKNTQIRVDVELRDAVKSIYELMLSNASLFKQLIPEKDYKHIDVIEKYLGLKGERHE